MLKKDSIMLSMINLVMGSVDVSNMLLVFEHLEKHLISFLQIAIGLMGVYYTYKNNQKNKNNKEK